MKQNLMKINLSFFFTIFCTNLILAATYDLSDGLEIYYPAGIDFGEDELNWSLPPLWGVDGMKNEGSCSSDTQPWAMDLDRNGLNIEIEETENDFRISGTPVLAPDENTVELTVIFRASRNLSEMTVCISVIIYKPIHLVFVLDKSGSMSGERWAKLRDGAQHFIDDIAAEMGIPNEEVADTYRYGVVYFSGDVDEGASSDDLTNFEGFDMGFEGVSTGGATSIGDGIAYAIDDIWNVAEITNSNILKRAVLFSDGEQNTSYWLNVEHDADGNDILYLGENEGDLDRLLPLSDHFQIYPISVFDSPNIGALFESISDEYVINEDGEIEGMSDIYNDVFNNFSPNHISIENQVLQKKNEVSFNCNKGVKVLRLDAIFDSGIAKGREYLIKKDNEPLPVEMATKLSIGNYYASYYINFEEDEQLNSEGKWTFTVIGDRPEGESQEIRLSATADDHAIDFETSSGEQFLKACDKMVPTVKFLCDGNPIRNAKVSAIVLKPGEDLGDILANTKIPPNTPTDPNITTCSERKINYLKATNSKLLEQLNQFERKKLKLRYRGDGVYSCPYKKLDVAGIYKIIFTAEADIPGLGKVHRMAERTVNVRFGDIKHKRTEPILVNQSSTNKILTFTPKYKSKHRSVNGNSKLKPIGPGFAFAFKFNGQGVQSSSVIDNCDGSYTLDLQLDGDPNIKLQFLGDVFYTGKVSKFQPKKRKFDFDKFGVNLRGGFTVPFQGLEAEYNPSLFGELGLSYNISRTLSGEILGGYYAFQDDFHIAGASASIMVDVLKLANLDKDTYRFELGGGPNYFQPRDQQFSLGYNLRFSFSRIIGRTASSRGFRAYIDGAFHQLDEANYSFATIGTRFRLNF